MLLVHERNCVMGFAVYNMQILSGKGITTVPLPYTEYDSFLVYQNEIGNDLVSYLQKAVYNTYSYEIADTQYNVTFYKLKRKTKLHKDQTIHKTESTVPNGFIGAEIYFDDKNDNEVFAKADDFILSGDLAGTLSIPNNYLEKNPHPNSRDNIYSAAGIACFDGQEYIRGLLKDDDTFKVASGTLSNNARLTITEISGFDAGAVRYITYHKDKMTFDGTTEINSDLCEEKADGEEGDYVLKSGSVVEVEQHDLLGYSGNYDNLYTFSHYELFFLDENLVNDLFSGKYEYNRYKIKANTELYKQIFHDDEDKIYLPTHTEWERKEEEYGYAKIVLKKIRIYFSKEHCSNTKEDEIIPDISGVPKKDYVLTVNDDACEAFIYNTKIAFAEMKDENRIALESIPDTFFKRYVELLNGGNAIQGKSFRLEYIDAEETKYRRGLSISDTDGITLSNFTFWISSDDLSDTEKFTTSDNTLYKIKSVIPKQAIYAENPKKPVMKAIDNTDIADITQIPEMMESELREYKLDEKTYWEFSYNNNSYYFDEADRTNQVDTNMLNFSEPEGDPLFTKDEDTDENNKEDIYCDDEKIRELCGDKVMQDGKLVLSSAAKAKLRKYACNFPMEWNKELYALCEENADCGRCSKVDNKECNYFPNKMNEKGFDVRYAPRIAMMKQRADVWNEAEILTNNAKKSIWHFHPIQFLEHLNKMGVLVNMAELRTKRIDQNQLRPEDPNGPCLFRALLAAAEEKAEKNFTLEQLMNIASISKESGFIGNHPEEYFFVNNSVAVIKEGLKVFGYPDADVTIVRDLLIPSGTADFTIRYIASKFHFQLGYTNGDLLWEPYKYNNPANAYIGKADEFRDVTITL